jgi:hypothetical protein
MVLWIVGVPISSGNDSLNWRTVKVGILLVLVHSIASLSSQISNVTFHDIAGTAGISHALLELGMSFVCKLHAHNASMTKVCLPIVIHSPWQNLLVHIAVSRSRYRPLCIMKGIEKVGKQFQ